jgi:DNA-binding GntR family transcriptional regulator
MSTPDPRRTVFVASPDPAVINEYFNTLLRIRKVMEALDLFTRRVDEEIPDKVAERTDAAAHEQMQRVWVKHFEPFFLEVMRQYPPHSGRFNQDLGTLALVRRADRVDVPRRPLTGSDITGGK